MRAKSILDFLLYARLDSICSVSSDFKVSSKFDCNLNEVMSAMLKMMLKVRYDEGFKATISKRLLENDELQTLLNIEIERSKRSPDLL